MLLPLLLRRSDSTKSLPYGCMYVCMEYRHNSGPTEPPSLTLEKRSRPCFSHQVWDIRKYNTMHTSSWVRSVGYAYRNTTVVPARPNSSCTPGRVASAQCHETRSETPSALLMCWAEVTQAFLGSPAFPRRWPGARRPARAMRREKSQRAIDIVDKNNTCLVVVVAMHGWAEGGTKGCVCVCFFYSVLFSSTTLCEDERY